MKNIQVIDGAMNSAYDIFQCEDEEFCFLFPNGTDIQFAEDLNGESGKVLEKIWKRPIDKKEVKGIHGTLFYELEFKRQFYPNRLGQDLTKAGGR